MKYQNRIDPRITGWFVKHLEKAELISVILVAAAFLLRSMQLGAGNPLITVTLSALAVFYYFNAFHFREEQGKWGIFFNKLLCFGWAICTIGILFTINGWPGWDQMLIIGSLPQIVLFIVILFMQSHNENFRKMDKKVLIRIAVIVALSMSFRFGSKEQLYNKNIITRPQIMK